MKDVKKALGHSVRTLIVYSFLGGMLAVTDLFFERWGELETAMSIVFAGVGILFLFPVVFFFELFH